MEETRNKRIKGIAKCLHIITKIFKILMIVGAVCIVIGVIIVPIVTNSIKVDTTKQTMEVFNQKFTYTISDSKVIFANGDDSFELTKKDEVKAFNEVIDYFEHNDIMRVTVGLELTLIFAIAAVCLMYLALKEIDKVFININNEDKIFLKANSEHMIKTAKYIIALIIVSIVSSIITSIAFGTDIGFNFDLSNVIAVIVLFGLAYIFEYGHELEEKSL